MKRSEINQNIKRTEDFLKTVKFELPRFAYWGKEEWAKPDKDVMKKTGLGWDITDFGMNDFENIGAVLFTIRNGTEDYSLGTPFAEKVIYIRDGQRLPCHHHVNKTEDIINRGGATLWLKLWNTNKDGSVDTESDVTVYSDGVPMTVKAGEEIEITTGNSITLTPYMNHTFGAKGGDLLVGEVSSVNDDDTDNYFSENVSRFADVEEDEPVKYPLCNEY